MKTIFLILISFFICLTMQSQKVKELKYGAKAGINYAQFINGSGGNDQDAIQFHLGVFSTYDLTNKLQLVGELIYNEKRGEDLISSNKLKVYTGYLDIPLSIKYSVLKKISVVAGPQLGIIIKKDGEITNTFSNDTFNIQSKDFNNLDFSINISLIFDINKFFIQPKYNHGLSEVLKDTKYKNRVISLSLGYKFN